MSNEYDDIPIRCCKRCLSLDSPDVEYIDGDRFSICPHCGCTETSTMTIDKWNMAFERKYDIGPYLKLPRGMKWNDIMKMSDWEQRFERNTERMIRNNKK